MSGAMATPYEAAAEELTRRVRKVLSKEGLAVYDGDTPEPSVHYGLPATVGPWCVWVDPLPHSVETSGGASGHEHGTEFSLYVDCVAKSRKREDAVRALQRYANSVYMGVMADATLNRTVNNALPRLFDSGCDVTNDKQFICAAVVEVRCKTFTMCPHEFRELIDEGQ